MNLSDSRRAQSWSTKNNKKKTFAFLLVSAALVAALFQSGCSGVTSAAPNSNAVVAPGQFSANTSSVNLGSVAAGDSKTVTLSFTNSTNSAVTILNISVSGPGFSASGVSSGTILNPGQTATLNVTFTSTSTGAQTGSITVTSNAQNSSITVALQASGVPAGDHSATLNWNPDGSPVTGYFIYRGPTSGGPYARLNTAVDASTTYTDLSVVAGKSYYYVVTAINSGNVESSYSNEVSATIPTP